MKTNTNNINYKFNEIKSIDVIGKRWFQRSYGNTYHSVEFTINHGLENEYTEYIPFTYGYDRQFETTALNRINELISDSNLEYIYQLRDSDIIFNSSVIDVNRKKDL